jgi:hypothetical protein
MVSEWPEFRHTLQTTVRHPAFVRPSLFCHHSTEFKEPWDSIKLCFAKWSCIVLTWGNWASALMEQSNCLIQKKQFLKIKSKLSADSVRLCPFIWLSFTHLCPVAIQILLYISGSYLISPVLQTLLSYSQDFHLDSPTGHYQEDSGGGIWFILGLEKSESYGNLRLV